MPLLLFALFIGLPIAELWVIIEIGGAIGVLPTLAILFGDGILGVLLVRSQGRAAWRRFNLALAEGRVPGRETADGAMILVGGAFLLTPGFITDAFAILLLLPPSRALIRRGVRRAASRRMAVSWRVATPGGRSHRGRPDPFAGAPGRPGPEYDYEGTAREVSESERELGRGGRDG